MEADKIADVSAPQPGRRAWSLTLLCLPLILVTAFAVFWLTSAYIETRAVDSFISEAKRSTYIGEDVGNVHKALHRLRWDFDDMPSWMYNNEPFLINAYPDDRGGLNLHIYFEFQNGKLRSITGSVEHAQF